VNGGITAASVTAAGVTATAFTAGSAATNSLTVNGDTPLQSAPRMFATTFFPGSLSSTWTAGNIEPDRAITVTRVTAGVKTPGAYACSAAILTVGDGSVGQEVPITGGNSSFDSGPESLNFPAGDNIRFSVQSPASCNGGTTPADTNVIVEYSMGPGPANACGSGQQECGTGNSFMCVSSQYDPNNCGQCAFVCQSGPNATPVCTLGACGLNCSTGYGNCDGNPTNGCETNLNTSIANCGACGNACNGTNGTPTCTSGSCGIVCNAGYANCDGNLANGCETNLNTSNSNCGACGYVCTQGYSCVAGVCEP
jgi:hypothetical protein